MQRREFITACLTIPAASCLTGSPGLRTDERRGRTLRLVDASLENPSVSRRRYRGLDYVDLGRDNVAGFRIRFPRTGYYRFAVRYGADREQRPPRAAFLLDRRVLGTTYYLTNNPADPEGRSSAAATHDLGEHLIGAGSHRLEVETLFEHGESLESITITPTSRPVEKARLSFVQLTDTHIQKNHFPIWMNRKICGDMPVVLDEFGRYIKRLAPDFVMLTGDIVDSDTPQSIRFAKEAVDPIPRPLFPVLGNHDTYRKNHENWLKIWNQEFPGDQVFYSYNCRGYHFVMLDCLYNNSAPLREPQFRWLDADLAQHSDYPTFIALHTPVGETGENPELTQGLLPRIRGNPQVKAIISGHTHINTIRTEADCAHPVCAAAVEYPLMFREFVIFENHMEIRSYQASRAMQRKSFMTVEEKTAYAQKRKHKLSERHTKIWNHMLGTNESIIVELGREYIAI